MHKLARQHTQPPRQLTHPHAALWDGLQSIGQGMAAVGVVKERKFDLVAVIPVQVIGQPFAVARQTGILMHGGASVQGDTQGDKTRSAKCEVRSLVFVLLHYSSSLSKRRMRATIISSATRLCPPSGMITSA